MPKDKSKGLYNKYRVTKIVGVPDPTAQYFILRLDDGGSDPAHIAACRKAVLVYAREIKEHLPVLAQDLIEAYGVSYGTHCPKCWEEDTKQIGFTPDDVKMNFQYACSACGQEWEGH